MQRWKSAERVSRVSDQTPIRVIDSSQRQIPMKQIRFRGGQEQSGLYLKARYSRGCYEYKHNDIHFYIWHQVKMKLSLMREMPKESQIKFLSKNNEERDELKGLMSLKTNDGHDIIASSPFVKLSYSIQLLISMFLNSRFELGLNFCINLGSESIINWSNMRIHSHFLSRSG